MNALKIVFNKVFWFMQVLNKTTNTKNLFKLYNIHKQSTLDNSKLEKSTKYSNYQQFELLRYTN